MAKVILRKRSRKSSHMPKIVEASIDDIDLHASKRLYHPEDLLKDIVAVFHDMRKTGVTDLIPSAVLTTKPGDVTHPTYRVYRGANVYCAAILLQWETLPLSIIPEDEAES